MAGFSRNTLKTFGLTDEQLEKVMTLHGTAMSDYILKADAETQRQNAIEEAKKTFKFNAKESDEYKSLEKEFNDFKTKITAKSSDDYKGIKDKFFDAVYDMIDHSKPVPEQLTKIKEQYEEYFDAEEQKPNQPQFGTQTQGQMPKGTEKVEFGKYWGFVPQRKG